jgi:alkylhydroperoxidase family enzyme
VAIARAAGLSDEEIGRVPAGPDAPGWSPGDAALLRAVDELRDDSCITDATWAALADRYGPEQLIEVPMLAGHYAMLAGALNSLGVPVDSDALPALGKT